MVDGDLQALRDHYEGGERADPGRRDTGSRSTTPPGIQPKAPGERLPVPAGWRSCHLRAPFGARMYLAAIKHAVRRSLRHPTGRRSPGSRRTGHPAGENDNLEGLAPRPPRFFERNGGWDAKMRLVFETFRALADHGRTAGAG